MKMNSITVVCPLVFFLLAIMLSVFLRFTYSDYPFANFKLFVDKTAGGQSKMDHHPETREISVTRHGTKTNIQKNKNNKEFTDKNASATGLFVSEGTIPKVVTVSAQPLCIRYINLQWPNSVIY